jgi:hypothetical protein
MDKAQSASPFPGTRRQPQIAQLWKYLLQRISPMLRPINMGRI